MNSNAAARMTLLAIFVSRAFFDGAGASDSYVGIVAEIDCELTPCSVVSSAKCHSFNVTAEQARGCSVAIRPLTVD